ncbi:MAG TPA: acetoacetyl-CoA reductase [Gammaproteobacteria bacterium]|nr:acetoacetyl-CoA reductase [Gammaproteobacteria bacterium]
MKTSLQGKVAVVTGGTGGIGTAICKQLADSGAKIAINYRNEDKLKKMQAACEGYTFHPFKADVTDFESCKKFIGAVEKNIGPVDILVNCAGITMDTTLRKMTKEQWDGVLTTNLDSVFNMSRHVVQGMTDRGFGRIINISSINGQKGQLGQTNYSAAKAGMHGFTMALAQEVARRGVTVNTVSPGYIATEMVMAVPEDIRKQIIAQIPVGRLGKPEEIACVVDFLCAPEAAFITGANISANGGQHMM